MWVVAHEGKLVGCSTGRQGCGEWCRKVSLWGVAQEGKGVGSGVGRQV